MRSLRGYREYIHDGRFGTSRTGYEDFTKLFRAATTDDFEKVWTETGGPSMGTLGPRAMSELGIPRSEAPLAGPDYLTWLLIRHGLFLNGNVKWDGKRRQMETGVTSLCGQAVEYAVEVLQNLDGARLDRSTGDRFRQDPQGTVVNLAAGYHLYMAVKKDWQHPAHVKGLSDTEVMEALKPKSQMATWGWVFSEGADDFRPRDLVSRCEELFARGGWR